mgnify:CR=1 FL=1
MTNAPGAAGPGVPAALSAASAGSAEPWRAPVAAGALDAVVELPGSKSLSARALLLAAVAEDFDRLPSSIRVAGNATHPSPFLVAAWLHHQLGVPVERVVDPEALTITDITFFFDDDTTVSLSRSATSSVARLSRPGLEDRSVNLARRSVQDSLMEALRRLDPDVYYGELLTTELPHLADYATEE